MLVLVLLVLVLLLPVATAVFVAGGDAAFGAAPAPEPRVTSIDGVGDRLLRTFLVFKDQPLNLTGAQFEGFAGFSSGYDGGECVPNLGRVLAANGADGPSKGTPTMLLFDAAGEICGFGVRAFGLDSLGGKLMGKGKFWLPAPNATANDYDLFVMLRDPSVVCDATRTHQHTRDATSKSGTPPLGDRVLINGHFPVPLTRDVATAKGFRPGHCIGKMGSHYWYDLSLRNGNMSWDAENLMPVLPMYLNSGPEVGKLHAILIATTNAQRIEPFGEWEGPFTRSLFCLNACKADHAACDKLTHVGGLMTTMHWEFMDPKLATCDGAAC